MSASSCETHTLCVTSPADNKTNTSHHSVFANNAIDTFDALLRKNIYGLKKRIFNINNDLIRVMYNCFEIVNGPMWTSWANSLCTVNM